MRIISLMFLAVFLCGCASLQGKKQEPQRNYPLYLSGPADTAAFKIQTSVEGKTVAAVLLITETNQNNYKVKIIGDYASILFDGVFKDNRLSVNYSLGDMAQGQNLSSFEEVLMLLLSKPSVFVRASSEGTDQTLTFKEGKYLYRYYFKKGLSFPYKVEQTKGIVVKKMIFEDYQVYGDRSLPSAVIVEGALGAFRAELYLISVK